MAINELQQLKDDYAQNLPLWWVMPEFVAKQPAYERMDLKDICQDIHRKLFWGEGMRDLTRMFLFLFVLVILSACSVAPRVESSYDGSMSISDFSTFNFTGPTEVEDPDQAGELSDYFAKAIETKTPQLPQVSGLL